MVAETQSPASAIAAGEVVDTSASGVSWPSIIAGAFAAAAMSFVLIILGSGFGLLELPHRGAAALTAMTIIWLIVVQWIASGLGGYLAGRLRVKWMGTHSHEVFFRDTAHGFLAWALATVLSVVIALSAVSHGLKGGAHLFVLAETGEASDPDDPVSPSAPSALLRQMNEPIAYYIDSLFRANHPNANMPEGEIRQETMRIMLMDLRNEDVVPARAYLARLIAERTGLSQTDSEKRVSDVLDHLRARQTQIREEEKTAGKTAATLSIFTALSLLIGAFIACVAGALGGIRRDEH